MPDPLAIFSDWYAAAQAAEINDPGACSLATIDVGPDGALRPDVRIVLMRGFDARGFAFYTNQLSAKGRHLDTTPSAALAFHWKSLRRQVRMAGTVTKVTDAESDAYFSARPRPNQLSAWASDQSQTLAERTQFEARLAEVAARFPAEVPRPPHWGGYRLLPDWIEYWEDRPGRQHHRERFDRAGGGWVVRLLYP